MLCSHQFAIIAERIIRRAPTYKTITACKAAGTRLKREYERLGSYGCVWYLYKEALAAIQDRSLVLYGEAMDAKYGPVVTITFDTETTNDVPATR